MEKRTCRPAASDPAGTSPRCTFEALDSCLRTSSLVSWKVSSVPDMMAVVFCFGGKRGL